ncbi:MAG: hypothetical protein QM756_09845 [Polyangiaceae bacterium]
MILFPETPVFPQGSRIWFDELQWAVLPARYRNSRIARSARASLASVFDDDFLRIQTLASHPIGFDWILRNGRRALFRVGAALTRFGISHETQTRLRDPKQYRACTAELDFGLFLALTSTATKHEPLAPSSGPDFLVESAIGACAFEVKAPNDSQPLAARSKAAVHLATELQRLVSQPSGKWGWQIEPRIASSFWPSLNDEHARSDTLTAMLDALKRWALRPTEAPIQVGAEVTLAILRRYEPGVQIFGPAFEGDLDAEAARLVNVHATRAATQLGKLNVPGFLVFSTEQSGLIVNYVDGVLRALRENPTAFGHVAGIVVFGLRPMQARLIPIAQVYLRAEARRLLPLLDAWSRVGCVSVRFF